MKSCFAWKLTSTKLRAHRSPEYSLENVAMRSGCILLTMDLQEMLQAKLGDDGHGPQDLAHQLAASAQAWLKETRLEDQLPTSEPVCLQVR